VIVGVAIAIACLFAVAFGTDAGAVIDQPPLVIAPFALILATAALSTALMRSDVQHRGEAVIDPLTGMLNRNALANRVSELAQQSEITGERVGVIVGDLDHFKRINDSYGHAAGDAVLTDLAYRIGGEEFLVLVPGSDLQESKRLAELLRRTVAACSFGDGARLTMSLGVSTSRPGQPFDYERVFASADEALYEAKSLGRNRVCAAELGERPAASSASVQAPKAATSTAS
jgi:diguanylate cyclase (GGDEF)-like protein